MAVAAAAITTTTTASSSPEQKQNRSHFGRQLMYLSLCKYVCMYAGVLHTPN